MYLSLYRHPYAVYVDGRFIGNFSNLPLAMDTAQDVSRQFIARPDWFIVNCVNGERWTERMLRIAG